ncbi:hypothetical protein [Rhodococcus sp. X156]|uniref:Rv2732c family membrane protein n=1 Tax=Rhodococcus sp. X156 TaxID=2499145 RepID=UPI000FDA4F09|nr:hypothetical protein [Rhodococcus sp. X156]
MDDNRRRELTDEELLGIRDEVDSVERRVTGTIEPGLRGIVIAVAVLAGILSMILPQAGTATGWDVLVHDDTAVAEGVILPLRLFAGGLVFVVIASAAALLARRWVLAWVATLGSGFVSFLGLLAVWSRQTLAVDSTGGGPGVGLFLAWAAVAVLTFQWLRIVWTRVELTHGRPIPNN